jgi:hypothetical protein
LCSLDDVHGVRINIAGTTHPGHGSCCQESFTILRPGVGMTSVTRFVHIPEKCGQLAIEQRLDTLSRSNQTWTDSFKLGEQNIGLNFAKTCSVQFLLYDECALTNINARY